MVSLSFSSFMLVMLLFIFLTIKDTIAHTDDQAKQIVHEAEIDIIRDLRSHLSVKKGDERENSMINPESRLNSKNSSTKLVSTDDQFDDNGSFQKLESEKLVDDSTEFFTMMNKDYVGVKQMVHEAENDTESSECGKGTKEVLDGVPAAAEFSNGKMMIERQKDMKEVAKADSSGASVHPV
uniref:Uncharacterized protein n=1 Tax=Solanum tuberosum TaxID=4113 RepID=M1C9Y5_SOLTU